MAPTRAADLETRLERLAAGLAEAAGDNLVSLVLYGSAAAGTHGGRSDVNLLLILRDASAPALHPLGAPLRDWTRHDDPPPLVFSLEGWRGAADVFPIEIEDIRQRHRVLRGTDPVEGLQTTREDLRHELEREARGLLIQLRASYAAAAGDGKALAAVVLDSFRTVLVLCRAAARLHGVTPPDTPAELVDLTARTAGLDPAAFTWPLAHRPAKRPPGLSAYDPRAAAYLDAVAAFVTFVDRS